MQCNTVPARYLLGSVPGRGIGSTKTLGEGAGGGAKGEELLVW